MKNELDFLILNLRPYSSQDGHMTMTSLHTILELFSFPKNINKEMNKHKYSGGSLEYFRILKSIDNV